MKPDTGPYHLSSTYLRLRSDVTVEPLPVEGNFWQRLASGALGSFHNEYLVTMNTYDNDWPMWEMHPNGDEVVGLLSGNVEFRLDLPGGEQGIALTEPGSCLIVPRGAWHTASVHAPSRLFFITAGEGTRHRQA